MGGPSDELDGASLPRRRVGQTGWVVLRRLLIAVLVLPAASCSDSKNAVPWAIAPTAEVAPHTTTFVAWVGRCGYPHRRSDISRPKVEFSRTQVVVTFFADPRPDGTDDCPSVQPVPVTVDLGRRLANRRLMDGIGDPPRRAEVSRFGATTTTVKTG